MGLLVGVTASALLVGTGVVVMAATTVQGASGGVDIWTLIEKGGAPLAGILFLALIEVTRRHDRKDRIIEAKDATILELSKRQTSAIETTNEIANDHMKIGRNTESLLRELVTLLRGKLDIG